MISEIIQPEKRNISYEFDLPVMVVHNSDPTNIIVLTKFYVDADNSFCYFGYRLSDSFLFSPFSIYGEQIKNWSKFKGKVVLSNFAENE